MNRNVLFRALAAGFAVIATTAHAGDKMKSEQAFECLASLQGEWQGQIDGINTTLVYTLTANGSALMEQRRPENGPEMITMFTIDGDHLLATHYCSAKNQPQMATAAITDAQKPLAFSLVRVTALKTPDAFHNTGLTLLHEGSDSL